jgi:hypothetical protein
MGAIEDFFENGFLADVELLQWHAPDALFLPSQHIQPFQNKIPDFRPITIGPATIPGNHGSPRGALICICFAV